MGECTITLQDVDYHLGLRTNGDPINGCVRDFRVWYGTETWEMVQEYLGGRPPTRKGKNYAGVKLSWLRQRVQMTLRTGPRQKCCGSMPDATS
ncbi:hypothetical protein PIB30_093038 [Stylosanthes scabra]|uniref:Uncharacterized protein n=1 Tax=Stylosanthes scabra TaxID=79078 RepID=A0ABU6UYM4_9FABA|nr:hypothetical protein [Stylosanthes scabra]